MEIQETFLQLPLTLIPNLEQVRGYIRILMQIYQSLLVAQYRCYVQLLVMFSVDNDSKFDNTVMQYC